MSSKINCQVCLCEYDHSKHKPYSLSNCPHTFCIDCIKRIKTKKCPMCQTFFKSFNPNLSLLEFVPQSSYDKAKIELEKIYNEANNLKTRLKENKDTKMKESMSKLDVIKNDIKQKADDLIQKVSANKKKLMDETEFYKSSLIHSYNSKLSSSASIDFKLYQVKSYLDTNKLENEEQINQSIQELKEEIINLGKLNEELINYKEDIEVKFDLATDPLDLGDLKVAQKVIIFIYLNSVLYNINL